MAEPATNDATATIDVDLVAAQFEALKPDIHRKALLEAIRSRDAYRKLTDELRAEIEKLKLGLLGPKTQRFKGEDDAQLSLAVLAELLGRKDAEGADAEKLEKEMVEQAEAEAEAAAEDEAELDSEDDDPKDPAGEGPHRNKPKRTGCKTAKDLVKVRVEVLPDEVKRLGTAAFERIGEETSTTIERRVSFLVELTVVRPKFRAKTAEAEVSVQEERVAQGTQPSVAPAAWITVAPPPELPIERGMAGPGLLANVIVRRFDDHLPY